MSKVEYWVYHIIQCISRDVLVAKCNDERVAGSETDGLWERGSRGPRDFLKIETA